MLRRYASALVFPIPDKILKLWFWVSERNIWRNTMLFLGFELRAILHKNKAIII